MIRLIEYAWFALGLYWLIASLRVKRVKTAENPVSQMLRRGFWVVGYVLVFTDWGRIGRLGERFVPRSYAIEIVGTAVAISGLALAVWARHCLGGNWSSAVTLKVGHELIHNGPYARIRHPIYMGFEVGFAGTALTIGEWRGLVVLAIAVAMYLAKARKEEAFLTREFGPAFDEHRRRTGMFLPRLITH